MPELGPTRITGSAGPVLTPLVQIFVCFVWLCRSWFLISFYVFVLRV